MKKIRVKVREVAFLTYEIEVDDDFTDYDNHVAVGDYLWADGVGPDHIENEVESEDIEDVWEV